VVIALSAGQLGQTGRSLQFQRKRQPSCDGTRRMMESITSGCVSRKASVFRQETNLPGKSQAPVVRMAGWRKTKTLSLSTRSLFGRLRVTGGRNESKRRSGLEVIESEVEPHP